VLQVVADKAEYFRRKTYHLSQIEEKMENGDLKVSYVVSNLDDLAAFIRSWGPHVKVLQPKSLAERIETDLEEALQIYRNGE
jgi:predicted DNA-binding transcriptional regulator YafY